MAYLDSQTEGPIPLEGKANTMQLAMSIDHAICFVFSQSAKQVGRGKLDVAFQDAKRC